MGLGGAQRLVVDLLETRASHIQPDVISLRDKRRDDLIRRIEESGGRYRTLSLSKWNPIGVLQLRDALRRGAYDLMHTHLEYSNSYGVISAASLGQRRPHVVRHIHADPSLHNSSVFRAVARATTRYVHAHVAPGPAVAAKVSFMLGAGQNRIDVIRPGVNLRGLEETEADIERVQSLRAGAKRVIGFVGRLVEQKDLETLLNAMPTLLAAEPATHLLIVGDGPLRTALDKNCRRKGLTHAVTFTGYFEHMADAYRAMDVLAHATKYEGLPLTLIEAMAMRVPVVASAATGVNDIITNGETGLLATPADVQSMSSNILRLFNEPGLSETMQNAAYDMIHKQYSRRRMTSEMEALYAQLVSSTD